MKKRVLSLLLIALVLLSGISTVFASSGKVIDIITTDSKIVDLTPGGDPINITDAKIKALLEKGYIQGYPDGTLGLDKNITRAEFATLIVNALELEKEVKNAIFATPKFSDVKPGEWYTPNLVVASNLGIINGYPDGTFKPNNEVSYQEALTMLVRMVLDLEEIAKVESSARYPGNYYQAAFNLGLLEDLKITSLKASATRGDVFIALFNSIEYMGVELIEPEKVEVDALVLNRKDKDVKLLILESKDLEEGSEIVATLDKENLNIGEVYALVLKGSKIVEIEDSYKGEIITGELVKDGQGIRIDRKRYSLDSIKGLLYNGEEVDFKSLPRRIRNAKATLYNGDLIYLAGYDFYEILAINEIKNDRVYAISQIGGLTLLSESRYSGVYLYEGGKFTKSSFKEIEVGDIAHIQRDGKDTNIILTRDQVSGIIGRYATEDNSVEIEGIRYKLAESCILAQERKFTLIKSTNMLKPYEGNDVVASLNINGEVQLINLDENALIDTKAVITDISGYALRVITETGRLDYYFVTEFTDLITPKRDTYDSRYNQQRVISQLSIGDAIKVLVDGKGMIEEVEVLPGKEVTITDLDNTTFRVGNKDYYLSENVAIFERAGKNYNLANIYDYIDLFYRNKNLTLEATVFEFVKEIEVIIIDLIDDEVKKELLDYMGDVSVFLSEHEAYLDNENIKSTALELENLLKEIVKDIEDYGNDDFKGKKLKLEGLVKNLETKIVDMLKADIELKLDDLKALREELLNQRKFTEADEVFLIILEAESSLEGKMTIKETEKLLEKMDTLLQSLEETLNSDEVDKD